MDQELVDKVKQIARDMAADTLRNGVLYMDQIIDLYDQPTVTRAEFAAQMRRSVDFLAREGIAIREGK